jgi:hypothetical protein
VQSNSSGGSPRAGRLQSPHGQQLHPYHRDYDEDEDDSSDVDKNNKFHTGGSAESSDEGEDFRGGSVNVDSGMNPGDLHPTSGAFATHGVFFPSRRERIGSTNLSSQVSGDRFVVAASQQTSLVMPFCPPGTARLALSRQTSPRNSDCGTFFFFFSCLVNL